MQKYPFLINEKQWEKFRKTQWKKQCKIAKAKPPKEFLNNKDEFDYFFNKLKDQGTKINHKEKVWKENNQKNWELYRIDMWKKKMTQFKDKNVPGWFLDREYVHDLFVNVLSKPFVTKMPDYTDMKKTKILIISDTHTSLSFINLIKKEKPDIAIHAGDFTQFNHLSFDFPDEEKNKYFKYWTNGNHEITTNILKLNLPDDYFFNMLRQYRTFKIQGKKFVLSHFFEEEGRIAKTISKRTGLIFDAYQWKSELLEKEKPNYVITGHTHVAHIIKEKNYTLINPGSPTVPRGESKPSYAIGWAENGKFTWEIKYLPRKFSGSSRSISD